MATSFNQAFPGLDLSDARALKDIFEKTEISSINYAENRTIVRIYLNADMLIPKYQIHRLEKEIKRQLFSKEPVSIQIIEHFNLSDQYTLPILIEEYKDSIMEDFKESNMAHYTMLMYSDWKLDGEHLIVTVNDNFLAHNAAPQIEQRIRKILSERCGFEVNVKLEFKENKNRRKRKDDDTVYMPASGPNTDLPVGGDGYADIPQGMPDGAVTDEYGMSVGASTGSGMPMDPGFQDGADAPITPLPVAPAPAPRSGSLSRSGGKVNSKYNSKNKRGFYDKDGKERHYKRTDEEGYIYGSSFEETEFTPIEELNGEASGVIAHGQISALEVRELKNKEKLFIQFSLTDFTDSIMVKIFLSATFRDEFLADFKDGIFIELKGVCMYDTYSKEYTLGSITGIRKGSDFRKKRVDNAPVKRVELHCHTKMSEMDAVSETKDIIKTAKSWGHSSIAITDHGVVHAFTDAFHALDKNDPFKVIYGCEGYLVDDLKHTELPFRLPKEDSNTSLTLNYVEIQRQLNLYDIPDKKQKQFLEYYLRTASAKGPQHKEYSILSTEETRELLARYEDGNTRIAREYLGEDGPLFSGSIKETRKWEPFNEYTEEDFCYYLSLLSGTAVGSGIRKYKFDRFKKSVRRVIGDLLAQ